MSRRAGPISHLSTGSSPNKIERWAVSTTERAADYLSSGLEPASSRLLVANLLGDLNDLSDLLAAEIERESWLNAFLLAAGLNQIVEDHLHENAISLGRVARHIRRVAPQPLGSIAAAAVRSADAALWGARSLPQSERGLVAWQRRAAALVDDLADAVVVPSLSERQRLAEAWYALLADRRRLPARLRRSIVRLPSCFRNFDQQPADIERLTSMFRSRWPDRERRILVVGVRTSGSYMAPLHGAYLRALGYENVAVLTFRPGQRWRRGEMKAVAAAIRSDGLAVVTDDPPKSGGSIAKTALELERLGFASHSIVLLFQTLSDTPRLPARIQRYPSVVLPWPDWSVQARLGPQAVQLTLTEMLGPAVQVRSVERLPTLYRGNSRGHLQARYRVQLREPSHGKRYEREIHVKGVGLGYFGDHASAVVRNLQDFFPEMIGLRDGLLYRDWLPEDSRLETIEPENASPVASAVVAYATRRAGVLPAAEDISLRLRDRGAVWQRAADLLARAYGPAGQFVRPVSYPLVKKLLRVAKPSVIDGSMGVDSWFTGGPSGLRKVNFNERAFNSLDVHCYDHVFDVAGVAPGTSDPELCANLRRAYKQQTGTTIDPERWLLYRLVHVAEQHRDQRNHGVEAERASTGEMLRYYEETVFADLEHDQTNGPMCGFDLDWSLETRKLGFPCITPAGAFALRALVRHGYRVVIATGRSIGEVRERCRAYRLIGGVAEYGAFTFDAKTGRVRDLLSPDDRKSLDLLRRKLSDADEIVLDPEYGGAVRAYRFDESGRRRGLSAETISSVLRATRLKDRVRVVGGAYQTDFMVNTIDKGAGLRSLAHDLGVESGSKQPGKLLALAVGDSSEDLPMLGLATMAVAPSNADAAVRAAGIQLAGKPDQLGAAQAVTRLIRHSPGACSQCEVTHLTAGSRLLLAALGAQDARGLGKIVHTFRLAARVLRTTL
jgi:hydroxymethylpyrimidine pyrophosphatase-like HAD family hydrolase